MTPNKSTRGGFESRADYRGQREDRRFGVGISGAPKARAATAGSSTAATITGAPIQYLTPYVVFDSLGSFTEIVAPGALSAILPTADCRFLVNHGGLALARTSSGTLTLTDTPSALTCRATLDPRSPTATEVIVAVGRRDISQMSIGFVVGEDFWSPDMQTRTITRFAELLDVSIVSFPASPTTSCELLDAPEHLLPTEGGADGTLGSPDTSGQDGTGRSAKRRLERVMQIDEDALRLSLPPVRA